MSGVKDWKVLVDDLDNPMTDEERAVAIAAVLATGKPSKFFCAMLAGMIHGKNNSLPFVLRLTRRRRQPGQPTDWPVARMMERLVDEEGQSPEDAVAEVQDKFRVKGNKRSKCMASLKAARQLTKDFNRDIQEVEEVLGVPLSKEVLMVRAKQGKPTSTRFRRPKHP